MDSVACCLCPLYVHEGRTRGEDSDATSLRLEEHSCRAHGGVGGNSCTDDEIDEALSEKDDSYSTWRTNGGTGEWMSLAGPALFGLVTPLPPPVPTVSVVPNCCQAFTFNH